MNFPPGILSFHIGCFTRDVIPGRKPYLAHIHTTTRNANLKRERRMRQIQGAAGAGDHVTLRERVREVRCSRSTF